MTKQEHYRERLNQDARAAVALVAVDLLNRREYNPGNVQQAEALADGIRPISEAIVDQLLRHNTIRERKR